MPAMTFGRSKGVAAAELSSDGLRSLRPSIVSPCRKKQHLTNLSIGPRKTHESSGCLVCVFSFLGDPPIEAK